MIYNNRIVPKHFLRTSQFSLILFSFLLISCGAENEAEQELESKNLIEKDKEQQTDSALEQKGMNPQDAVFQDTLKNMKKLVPPTEAIGSSFFNPAEAEFPRRYSTSSTLNYDDIKVDFSDGLLTRLFQQYPNTKDKGLVFLYGLSKDLKNVVYIIGDGKKKKGPNNIEFDQIEVNIGGNNVKKYILLQNSSTEPIKYIDRSEMCTFTKRYCDNMVYTYFSTNYINIDCNIKPRLIYHEGSELNNFYTFYKDEPNLKLFITHGAAIPKGSSNIEHVPIFSFGDTKKFPLDNQIYAIKGPGKYEKKGLDVGQLCPPWPSSHSQLCP